MGFFRKLPVVIEARQLDATNGPEIAQWCGGVFETWECPDHGLEGWVNILTLEGIMEADLGDWVIRGVQGEFYPCRADIFEQTYEEVDVDG